MLLIAIALLAQAAPSPPPPLHYGHSEMVCPVGGQHFTAGMATMFSIMGRRPDDKPYSELSFPAPRPRMSRQRPGGLHHLHAGRNRRLAKWVATPVYQAMRKTESPFYRAYWLAMKIHQPEADALEQLLPAIWEAKQLDGKDPRRPRTARYQRVLVDAVEALPPSVPLDDRIWLQGQAANALREMGKFGPAETMRQRGEAAIAQTKRPALAVYLQKLKAAIARRDRSDEPLDMIPDVQAAIICKNSPRADAFDRAYCAQPKIAAIVKQLG